MPKDEFDFADPFELNGMAILTHEDTTAEMAECFIEEFMRMGYNHEQLLALFRNPHYLGPNMVYEQRGEPFIRELISEVFARWGRTAHWAEATRRQPEPAPAELANPSALTELEPNHTDPMGAPLPKLSL